MCKEYYYITIDGEQIPVTKEVYYTYKRAEWRESKQKQVRAEREGSYDYMAEHGAESEAVMEQELVEDIVADKLLLDELYAALAELTNYERNLINALFFDGKSERTIAAEQGVQRNTIVYHKNKIISKLRNILKKF